MNIYIVRIINYDSLWGQLSTTCNNAAEVARWATPSCSRPQPAMDNALRYGKSNYMAVPLSTTCTIQIGAAYAGMDPETFRIYEANHLAYAATRAVHLFTQAIHLTTQAIHLATQAIHLTTQAIHLATQAIHLATQAIHLATQAIHLATQAIHLATLAIHLATLAIHLATNANS